MLEIKDIHVSYGKTEIIHGLSMDVQDHELVALIGANGAGKSTTLRTISGLLRPTSGKIIYDGKVIVTLPPEQIIRQGIAHCPESRRVWPRLTVEENLNMGGFILKKAELEPRKQRMYKYFPILKERRRQLAGCMSGGEQQMLAIARSLMTNPTFLLFDEPSLGLAPCIVEQVMEIIVEINRDEKITVLLVEQNANMALAIADRAYVVETGRIAMEGTASDLRENDYVRAAYLGK